MDRGPDLERLLKVAVRVVGKRAKEGKHIIRIGGVDFSVILEKAPQLGWILVLIQDEQKIPSDEVLKNRFGLTRRERQVARLLASRYSNREIAEELDVTIYTAGRHTERVLRKLGLSTRKDVRRRLES